MDDAAAAAFIEVALFESQEKKYSPRSPVPTPLNAIMPKDDAGSIFVVDPFALTVKCEDFV
jgi:hypothetical protein